MVLPLLGVAFPVVALAQAAEKTAASVKTALFKDIATYPEQNVAAQVVAANQVQISAQIAGVVQTWRVDTGAKVNRGATLAQLDPRDMSLALAQAQAAQQAATARLDLAKQQLARAKELVKKGFFASEALNQRETEVALLEADLSARNAAVASAKHALSKTNITAPFNAVVVQRMAQVGNTVAPGTPLFELVDTAAPEIATDLSVAQANSLKRATDIRWHTPGQQGTRGSFVARHSDGRQPDTQPISAAEVSKQRPNITATRRQRQLALERQPTSPERQRVGASRSTHGLF